jgi:hypothetical protein
MVKNFVGGYIGCALLTFSDKSLHLFPQPRELFPAHPDWTSRLAGQYPRPMPASHVAQLYVEAELARLN